MATLAGSGAGSGPEHLARKRLGVLRAEVGDECLDSFVKAFLIMLDERLSRIGAAVSGSTADALRAERDLRVGCAMLGADRLTALLVAVDIPLLAQVPLSPAELADLLAEVEAVSAALSSVLEETSRP